MLTRWSDLDRTFTVMDQLRRRMDRLFEEYEPAWPAELGEAFPRTNLHDGGAHLVVTAEVPGLADKDIRIDANQDGLTISGERRAGAPEGYSVHRQERPSFKFSRSLLLPCKVDTEKATASLANGVLTVTIPKAADAQPRRISIMAS